MRFFSEKYSESIRFTRKEKPAELYWEAQKNADRRHEGCNRIDLHAADIPCRTLPSDPAVEVDHKESQNAAHIASRRTQIIEDKRKQ